MIFRNINGNNRFCLLILILIYFFFLLGFIPVEDLTWLVRCLRSSNSFFVEPLDYFSLGVYLLDSIIQSYIFVMEGKIRGFSVTSMYI